MKLQKKNVNNRVSLDGEIRKRSGYCEASHCHYTECEDVPFGWGTEYCIWYDVELLKIGRHYKDY